MKVSWVLKRRRLPLVIIPEFQPSAQRAVSVTQSDARRGAVLEFLWARQRWRLSQSVTDGRHTVDPCCSGVSTAEISRANPPPAHGYLYDSKCKSGADKQGFYGVFYSFFFAEQVSAGRMTRMTRDLRAEGHQHPEWLLRSAERLFEVCVFAVTSLTLFVCFFSPSWKAVNLVAAAAASFFFSTDGRKRWQDDQPVTRTPKGMSGGVLKVPHNIERKKKRDLDGKKKCRRKLLDLFIYFF